jgi:hypothetical protein
MYAILDKAKPHSENIKGFNLAAVIYTTVQVYTAVLSNVLMYAGTIH